MKFIPHIDKLNLGSYVMNYNDVDKSIIFGKVVSKINFRYDMECLRVEIKSECPEWSLVSGYFDEEEYNYLLDEDELVKYILMETI